MYICTVETKHCLDYDNETREIQTAEIPDKINKQLEPPAEPPKPMVKAGDKSRKEKLSNYLIDISKYVMTGVVIASMFKDLDDNRQIIYVLGLFIAFMALGTGLVLTDKKKGN